MIVPREEYRSAAGPTSFHHGVPRRDLLALRSHREVRPPVSSGAEQAVIRIAKRLSNPEAFAHPAGDIRIIETHLSRVVLIGQHAYQITKPLKLAALATALARQGENVLIDAACLAVSTDVTSFRPFLH